MPRRRATCASKPDRPCHLAGPSPDSAAGDHHDAKAGASSSPRSPRSPATPPAIQGLPMKGSASSPLLSVASSSPRPLPRRPPGRLHRELDCFFSIEFRKHSECEDLVVYFTDRLLHGLVLLPSGISVAGTGNAML